MNSTTISIIIVCRNACVALEKTLRHMFELGDQRVRLIVIDGASNDGTLSVLDACRERLFYCVSEPDNGIYDAMNKGWVAAVDDSYVMYLGAGDKVLTLPAPEDTLNADGSAAQVLMGDCLIGDSLFVSRWGRSMRYHNTAHHQALLIHKRLHPGPPFDSRLRIFGDWDFNLRLFNAGIQAKHVERFRAYAAPDGTSSNPDLQEVVAVATRHSGQWAGCFAWARYRAFLIWRELRRPHA
jgi:glycosyltransferase involved in cell wall biosynthesis